MTAAAASRGIRLLTLMGKLPRRHMEAVERSTAAAGAERIRTLNRVVKRQQYWRLRKARFGRKVGECCPGASQPGFPRGCERYFWIAPNS